MEIDKIANDVVNQIGMQSFCLVGVIVNEREMVSLKWKSLTPSQIISMLEQIKFNILQSNYKKQNLIEDIG